MRPIIALSVERMNNREKDPSRFALVHSARVVIVGWQGKLMVPLQLAER